MTKPDETVKVRSYERRAPSGQKARTDNHSKISDPQDSGEGVKIMSSKPAGPQGVERLSRREPGELQSAVEVHVETGERTAEGKKPYRRII
jgi:hypothetical protein